jgi:hypothetical protein
MPAEQDKRSFTRADILGVISIVIAVGFGILPYFHPPDPAHPWSMDFINRTVSFPLWKTVLGGVAGMLGAFQLGRKRIFSPRAIEKLDRPQALPTTTQPQIVKPVISQSAKLISTSDTKELTLKMPDRFTVRIHPHEFDQAKALMVVVDNNRLDTICKVKTTIYSAQSFDADHGDYRDGFGFQAGIISQPDNILPSTTGKTDLFVRKDAEYSYLLAFDDYSHPLSWPSNDKSVIQKWRLSLGITASTAPMNSSMKAIQFNTEKLVVILTWNSVTNDFAINLENA